ncbi:hypothetical protein SAMN05216223_11636 [Actinacidiphila yanglinensis]|uniref:Uncharacterized protein n=2 Tax=Actinacidiphila yanglinensis TaxID=310779 RepID=A0A1H6DJK7_9ACTN|nr:hypothetical protein SAMN05216223_11636 [Actinacidiphila yanglinensis]
MRDLVRVMVVLAVAAAIYVGWRRSRYPGGWAYAFSPDHADARDDLDSARQRAGALERASRKEARAAQWQLHRERSRHRERVRVIERRIASLRRPGRGGMVASLGEVTLHEHSVVADGREIPLAGLTVRLDHAQQQHFLYLTKPDGWSSIQKFVRTEHDEESVRRFAVQLENAVAEENAFRIRAAAQLEQAEDDLAEARGDTGAQDEARTRIAEVAERHRRDTRRGEADKELQAACDRWQQLTGRRPG